MLIGDKLSPLEWIAILYPPLHKTVVTASTSCIGKGIYLYAPSSCLMKSDQETSLKTFAIVIRDHRWLGWSAGHGSSCFTCMQADEFERWKNNATKPDHLNVPENRYRDREFELQRDLILPSTSVGSALFFFAHC